MLKNCPQRSPTGACTYAGGSPVPSHRVSSNELLACRGCHSAKCFSHIMTQYRVHSSTAIMIHGSDANQDVWHKFHVANKNDYAAGYSDLVSAMKNWSQYYLDHRIIYFALDLKPRQLVQSDVRGGFYDVSLPDIVKVRSPVTPFTISHPMKQRQSSKASVASSTSTVQPPKKTRPPTSQSGIARSRTPSTSSLPPPRPTKKRRERSPDQDAEESAVEEVLLRPKRRRTYAQEVWHIHGFEARLSGSCRW